MSYLPEDDKERKLLPMLKMVTGYFPKALREVTRVCVANNTRFNPDRDPADIRWARGKSPDQLGSAFRHIVEHEVDGKTFEMVGGVDIYVLAEAAWRVLAALELEIEAQENQAETPVPAETGTFTSQAEFLQGVFPDPHRSVMITSGGSGGSASTVHTVENPHYYQHTPPILDQEPRCAVNSTRIAPVIGCSCPTCNRIRTEVTARV